MNTTITIEPTDSVPESATVRHFDELTPAAQENFPALAAGVPSAALFDCPGAAGLDDGDVVVFTGYYRVNVT